MAFLRRFLSLNSQSRSDRTDNKENIVQWSALLFAYQSYFRKLRSFSLPQFVNSGLFGENCAGGSVIVSNNCNSQIIWLTNVLIYLQPLLRVSTARITQTKKTSSEINKFP